MISVLTTHQTLTLTTLVPGVREGHPVVVGVAQVITSVTPGTATGVCVGAGAPGWGTLHLHTVH